MVFKKDFNGSALVQENMVRAISNISSFFLNLMQLSNLSRTAPINNT